jgi:rRNA-processing protein FCF1
MLQKIKNFFWALKRWNLKVVVDACILLDDKDLEKLKYLYHVFIPRAVLEQINRLAINANAEDTSEMRGQQMAIKIQSLVLNKIRSQKWQIAGSTGTGLLQSIENKKIGEFGKAVVEQLEKLYKRKKEIWNGKRKKLELAPLQFDSKLILRDLIGSTDLRIIASCLNLKRKNKNVILITRDKTLAILAQALGINVKQSVNDL